MSQRSYDFLDMERVVVVYRTKRREGKILRGYIRKFKFPVNVLYTFHRDEWEGGYEFINPHSKHYKIYKESGLMGILRNNEVRIEPLNPPNSTVYHQKIHIEEDING